MRNHGFTLIELLVVVAVTAVLALIALPAFSGAMEATRASGAESQLLASLTRAINRSAVTGTRAVLCPSADGRTCRRGPDWSGGWIGFLDPDVDRERDPDEPVFFNVEALPGKVRLRSSVGRTRIVFQGNGGNAGSNVTFTLCDGRGGPHARTLVLNNRGGLRHGTPSAESIAATCAVD
jgi:type IV fimbrial biogenesis protein FimT